MGAGTGMGTLVGRKGKGRAQEHPWVHTHQWVQELVRGTHGDGDVLQAWGVGVGAPMGTLITHGCSCRPPRVPPQAAVLLEQERQQEMAKLAPAVPRPPPDVAPMGARAPLPPRGECRWPHGRPGSGADGTRYRWWPVVVPPPSYSSALSPRRQHPHGCPHIWGAYGCPPPSWPPTAPWGGEPRGG